MTTTKATTFKQPFLDKIKQHLESAVSITWEGCHKIYICLDQQAHEQQISYGYDMVMVDDQADALNQLHEWFESSCGLRFINAVDGQGNFHEGIGQFEYDEE